MFAIVPKFHHKLFIAGQFFEDLFFFVMGCFVVVNCTYVNVLFVLWLDMSIVVAFPILAILTFTFVRVTADTSLEAFAVLLLAVGGLAFAAFVVLALVFADLGFESQVIPLENLLDCPLPFVFMFKIVVAIIFSYFVALAFRAADCFVP